VIRACHLLKSTLPAPGASEGSVSGDDTGAGSGSADTRRRGRLLQRGMHADLDTAALERSRDRQLRSAARAVWSKAAASAPGTTPFTSSWLEVIVGVPEVSRVTVAVTRSRSGGVRCAARTDPRAMVKQAACAAAMNSSGLALPSGSPNRDATVMGRSLRAPLPPEACPEPRAMLPVQSTSAVRCTAAMGSTFDDYAGSINALCLGFGPDSSWLHAVEDRAGAVCCRHGQPPLWPPVFRNPELPASCKGWQTTYRVPIWSRTCVGREADHPVDSEDSAVGGPAVVIWTPDQRLRVFVSSTVGEHGELAEERQAVARAISLPVLSGHARMGRPRA
jgi:hypothetical protein